jgi:Holliday junction DNA helicase RuvA
MYAYINGKIVDKANNYVVIDNGGIGYKIFMSPSVIEKLPDTGENLKVYTYYYVREDNIALYGFLSNEELRMFELLLSVSGIGAKSAIQILSSITPSSFALAVISNDVSKIVKIPGIGNKTAGRIILELKDKLKTEQTINQNEKITKVIDLEEKDTEAITALQVLGYTRKEISKVLEKIDTQNLTVEEIIKKALLTLGNQ